MRASEIGSGYDELTERIIACGRAYRQRVERGEVEPPKTDANGNIISSDAPRRFTIKDIGLHSEAQIS